MIRQPGLKAEEIQLRGKSQGMTEAVHGKIIVDGGAGIAVLKEVSSDKNLVIIYLTPSSAAKATVAVDLKDD
jgi:hypothetical protein